MVARKLNVRRLSDDRTSSHRLNGEEGESKWGRTTSGRVSGGIQRTPPAATSLLGRSGAQQGGNSWREVPTNRGPLHKTHFLLVLGIARCDALTHMDKGQQRR